MIQARAAFRYPNYRYYMSARFLTPLASEMQAVAVAWQVYGLTHRPLDLGLVGLAQFLPGIFLFLAAGHTADRVPRLRILQTCLAAFSLCSVLLLALTARGLASVYPIYAVLLLNGAVRAFNGPAGQAFLPLLVPEEDFPNAVAWSSSIFQAATIAGPMIGGVLYGLSGSPIPVYASAVHRVSRGIGAGVGHPGAGRGTPARSLFGHGAGRASATSGATSWSWAPSRWTFSRCCWAARWRCCRCTRAKS
jgi:MFS family permease